MGNDFEQFEGRVISRILLDSLDCRLLHVYFTDGTQLEITAYSEFDGCNDFNGTYLLFQEKESGGGVVWEKDTNI